MAIAASAPKDPFRLSMLIYDTRYRSYTIQVVVLLLFLAFLGWLLNNTAVNLAAKDKDINFGFLFQRAGYDIDQQLIPYTNDSTHGRALFVGLFNTLIIAALGCVAATVIGVFAGVLRLSHNWVVSRLVAVYIETVRNIPLLLWIILAFVVLSETAPAPNTFKVTQEMIDQGTEPASSKIFFGTVAVTNRGTNIPRPFVDHPLGAVNIFDVPVNLTMVVGLLILGASIFVSRGVSQRARHIQETTGQRPTTWWKNLLILVVPIVAYVVALGTHLDIPAFPADANGVSKGFNFQGGLNVAHSFTALLIAISLYTGSFIAEAVRGGVLAISKGQTEAAYALGLRPGRTMRLVILPQALRVIIPPLISQYLNLTKNTTLGMAISYLDLKGTLGGITLNQTGRELECMILMMAIYLTLSLIISSMMNVYNNAMKLKER